MQRFALLFENVDNREVLRIGFRARTRAAFLELLEKVAVAASIRLVTRDFGVKLLLQSAEDGFFRAYAVL